MTGTSSWPPPCSRCCRRRLSSSACSAGSSKVWSIRKNRTMASISLRKVLKRYGTTEVIHGVDAEIADGEFIVIVGPSGCGKSTLLRMVAGLEEISGGEIAIANRVV